AYPVLSSPCGKSPAARDRRRGTGEEPPAPGRGAPHAVGSHKESTHMMRRFVSAALLVAFAGPLLAKEHKNATATKVDAEGKKITFKVEGEDKARTVPYDDATKFYLTIKGEPKEVPAKFLGKVPEKGVPGTVTTDDDDKKVTKVILGGDKKKKDDK